MNQYSELERAARVVVRIRDLHREDRELFADVLDTAITVLQGAVIDAELQRQVEIPLPEFDAVKWREIAAGGCQREDAGE